MIAALALPDVLAAAVVVSLLVAVLNLRQGGQAQRDASEAAYTRQLETQLKDCNDDRYRLLDRIGRLLNGGER